MRSLILGSACGLLMAQAPPLSFDHLMTRAKPAPGQLELESLLAEHRRELAGTRGFLREGPSVGAALGPRRTLESRSTDQAVEVDLPLFLAMRTRRGFEGALASATPLLREAAATEARLDLRRAFLDAWLEQQLRRLAEDDLATVRAWLAAARTRLAAGADPAFQVSLVEGELLRAQLEHGEARARETAAWGALRLRAEVPEVPLPLAAPEAPTLPPATGLEARFQAGALRSALPARLALEQRSLAHRAAADQSRWSLKGGYAREGEDRIARVGLAYRFRRPGEAAAAAQGLEAAQKVQRQSAEQALAGLDTRFRTALVHLEASRGLAPVGDPEAALQAVTLRLEAGRERPSEALPIRRQLLDVRKADLRRRHAQALLLAELDALTQGDAR